VLCLLRISETNLSANINAQSNLEEKTMETNSYICGDTLIRSVPVPDSNYKKAEVVITKEEFIACYNAWIKEADNETD